MWSTPCRKWLNHGNHRHSYISIQWRTYCSGKTERNFGPIYWRWILQNVGKAGRDSLLCGTVRRRWLYINCHHWPEYCSQVTFCSLENIFVQVAFCVMHCRCPTLQKYMNRSVVYNWVWACVQPPAGTVNCSKGLIPKLGAHYDPVQGVRDEVGKIQLGPGFFLQVSYFLVANSYIDTFIPLISERSRNSKMSILSNPSPSVEKQSEIINWYLEKYVGLRQWNSIEKSLWGLMSLSCTALHFQHISMVAHKFWNESLVV